MPWYSTGTVSVVPNSDTVTGSGTAFSANARAGDAFRGRMAAGTRSAMSPAPPC